MTSGRSLDKTVRSDHDFEVMGWHDAAVHAIAVEPGDDGPGRLLLDLDYIVEWIDPGEPGGSFKFWICPATLVFHGAWDLEVRIDAKSPFEISVDTITRSPQQEDGQRHWVLEGDEFSIWIPAEGYLQYMRRPPILSELQRLSLQERGGISFDERGYDP
jgi:hypothetical protein